MGFWGLFAAWRAWFLFIRSASTFSCSYSIFFLHEYRLFTRTNILKYLFSGKFYPPGLLFRHSSRKALLTPISTTWFMVFLTENEKTGFFSLWWMFSGLLSLMGNRVNDTSFKINWFVVVVVVLSACLRRMLWVSRNRKQLDHVFPSQPIRGLGYILAAEGNMMKGFLL